MEQTLPMEHSQLLDFIPRRLPFFPGARSGNGILPFIIYAKLENHWLYYVLLFSVLEVAVAGLIIPPIKQLFLSLPNGPTVLMISFRL